MKERERKREGGEREKGREKSETKIFTQKKLKIGKKKKHLQSFDQKMFRIKMDNNTFAKPYFCLDSLSVLNGSKITSL